MLKITEFVKNFDLLPFDEEVKNNLLNICNSMLKLEVKFVKLGQDEENNPTLSFYKNVNDQNHYAKITLF